MVLNTLLLSTGAVFLAEIGDKTQLLSLALAARYARPVPIIAGVLVATLLNHALAAALGATMPAFLSPTLLRWIVAASFVAMGAWMLVPDSLGEARLPARGNVFVVTCIAFFIAEMGDKTQVATVGLAASQPGVVAVVLGTTLGMLLANAPVALLGERATRFVSVAVVNRAAALLFVAIGLWVGWAGLPGALPGAGP